MNRVQHLLNQLQPANESSLESTETASQRGKIVGPTQYGGRLVASALVEQGVSHVFTLTGGHIAPILCGCNQAGIRVIDVRDEVTTVFAADAVARVTGIPGVAIVTAGPGLTNTITAVKNAQMAQSPIIVMGGATSMLLKGRGSLQDIDQFALMKPHTKWCHSITKVSEIIPVLRKAFAIASKGVPGPVFIEYPLETIWPQEQIMENVTKEKKPKFALNANAILAVVADVYTRYHVDRVFRNAYDPPSEPFRPIHVDQYMSNFSDASMKNLLSILTNARRPVIVIGSQACLHPSLMTKLVTAIEYLNLPVFLSGMARGLLGRTHPLQLRHKRGAALSKADCVILCGVPCDFRLDYGRGVNRKAFFAMVNLDKFLLNQNSDLRRKNLLFCGDPCAFILRLAESAERFRLKFESNKWMKELRFREAQRDKEIDLLCETNQKATLSSIDALKVENRDDPRNYVHPIRCCRMLEKVIDDDSYMIADGGDFVGTAAYILKPRRPLRWLDPGVFGTLGVGAGFAMGVKALNPKSEVWILFGDGSFGWSMAEFDTFKRMKLPVIAVIGNDACWSQMYRDQVRLMEDTVATELEYQHYDKAVEGFGCKGILIKNEAELEAGLMRAKALAKEGYPVVVNVLITKSTFREGSISL